MITINKSDFLNAIKVVELSCIKNNFNPILSTIHIKTLNQALQLTSTDTTISSRIVVEANVTEELEICVNADKLRNIISILDNIITIEKNEQLIKIKSGKTKFELLTLSPTEYPIPSFELTDDKIILSKDNFIKGINKTIISSAAFEQSLLSGICLTLRNGGYEMAATDGNRLSQVIFNDDNITKESKYIIPHKVLANIAKIINDDVEIYFNDSKITFKSSNFMFSTQLISGVYPPYTQLIPKDQPIKISVKRNDLLRSLEKVTIMSDLKTNITHFNFKNGELELTTSCDEGEAKDIINVDFEGEFSIVFNFKYIIDALKVMQTDYVSFEMNNTQSAGLIVSDFVYLCMPISLGK